MAVLEKIRVRMGIFITVLIAVALLSFIVDPSTLQSALNMFSSKNDVGSIDGNGISYQEFAKKVQYYTDIQQLLTGATSLDEQSLENVHNGAWQECLTENLLLPAVEKAGIGLGTEEMLDLAQGKSISPVIAENPIFADPATGAFDRTRLLDFIHNVKQDPNYAKYWEYLEKSMEQEQIVNKYASLLIKSLYVTPVELRRSMEEHNQSAEVDFVLTPIGFNRDTTIVISNEEIRDYYRAHMDSYEQTATRDFEYVVFDIQPSLKDIELAEADAVRCFDEFAKTGNMRQFLARNSDKAYDNTYYNKGEIEYPAVDSFAFAAKNNEVLPVYQDGNTFRAARITGIKQLPDSVMVHHILIQRSSTAEAKNLCDSLVGVLNKGADFTALATQFSADQSAGREPGVLGWMTSRAMIPGFDTLFTAPINKYFSLETQYGYHVVKAAQKTPLHKKVSVAILEKVSVPGKETFQDYYSKANTLSSECETTEEFNTKAKENGWGVVPAIAIPETAKKVASYDNTREMIRWTFNEDTKEGAVSPVFSVENKYFFVATLTGKHEKGISTLQEKSREIKDLIMFEKRLAKLKEEVKANLEGVNDIHEYAAKVGATVTNRTGVSFGSEGTQQTDSKLTGAVAGAEVGKLTGPVEGLIGVYALQVKDRQTGAFYTEEDARRQNVNAVNAQGRMIMMVLTKAGKVEDNRAKFF